MKQRNPNSINLQVNNCKKVEISKLYQNHNPSNEEVSKLVESILSDMLTIVFEISKSKRNKEAIELATELLDGKIVKSTVWIMVPDSKIFEKGNAIKHITRYIQDLKSTKAYFKGVPVDLNRFINTLSQIRSCSHTHFESRNGMSCWRNFNDVGWGCKYINSVKRKLAKISDCNQSTYWYNFGYFCDTGEWQIDKELIRQVIFKEVNETGINLCPQFCSKKLVENIDSLPNTIIVDNDNFKNHYRRDFLGSGLLVIPENIRHIPQMTEEEKIEREKACKIKELEYLIGMKKLSGKDLQEAKEQLLVLKGMHESYAKCFTMELHPQKGYKYSDN